MTGLAPVAGLALIGRAHWPFFLPDIRWKRGTQLDLDANDARKTEHGGYYQCFQRSTAALRNLSHLADDQVTFVSSLNR